MIPTLAEVCSLNSPFAKDVEDYAAGGCGAVEVWLTKLETHLASHSVEDVQRLVEHHDINLPVASFQGGLLSSQGEERKAHWEHFEQRLQLCRQLNIETMVVACDIADSLSQELLDRVSASLTQAADLSARHNVRIALEFQRQATFGNNLQTAATMVAEAGRANVGICLDAFQFFNGPSKLADLGYLTADNLFHVQLCDIAGVPRELASDSHRIVPGDGDWPIGVLIDHLRSINYRGHVSIELHNPTIWQVPARQFGEIAMSALGQLLESPAT
mgnify:CR=1 FL=1